MLNHRMKRLDLMRALGNDEVMSKTYPGQDDYAKELGIPVDDSVTGADMVEAYKMDDWDTIIEHGESDVLEMMKVFVQRTQPAMEEFFDHYDELPDKPPQYAPEVEY